MSALDRRACQAIAALVAALCAWFMVEVALGDAHFGIVRGLLGLEDYEFSAGMFEVTVGIIGFVAALVLAREFWQRHRGRELGPEAPRFYFWLAAALLALATLAARDPLVSRLGFDAGDEYAYVLGPKYFPELGYEGLYDCSVVATRELGRGAPEKIRDLTTNEMVKTRKHVNADVEAGCRAAFTPARWQAFLADVNFFRSHHSRSKWEHRLSDHGYNGTPFWTFAARPLAELVPIADGPLALLSLLNLALVGLALGCVVWSFGWERGLCFAVLFSVNYLDRYLLGDAYFRYVWITCVLIGLSLWHRERHVGAAILLTIAAFSTIFPVLFFAGIGAWAAHVIWLERKQPAAARAPGFDASKRFVAAAMVTGAVCLAASLWRGFDTWQGFLAQMELNAGRFSYMRVGLIYDFLWPKEFALGDPGLNYVERAEAFRANGLLVALYWGTIIGLSVVFVRNGPRIGWLSATILLAFTLFFGVFSTVRYYYAGFVGLPLAFFAIEKSKLDWRVWCAGLCMLSAGAYWVIRNTAREFVANTYLSFGFTLLLVGVALFFVHEERRLAQTSST